MKMEKFNTITKAKGILGLKSVNNGQILIEVFQDESSNECVDFYMHNDFTEITLERYEKDEVEKINKKIDQLRNLKYNVRFNGYDNY